MCRLLNIRVPEDITEEATRPDGPEVSFVSYISILPSSYMLILVAILIVQAA
jgi:hypothetical protein